MIRWSRSERFFRGCSEINDLLLLNNVNVIEETIFSDLVNRFSNINKQWHLYGPEDETVHQDWHNLEAYVHGRRYIHFQPLSNQEVTKVNKLQNKMTTGVEHCNPYLII